MTTEQKQLFNEMILWCENNNHRKFWLDENEQIWTKKALNIFACPCCDGDWEDVRIGTLDEFISRTKEQINDKYFNNLIDDMNNDLSMLKILGVEHTPEYPKVKWNDYYKATNGLFTRIDKEQEIKIINELYNNKDISGSSSTALTITYENEKYIIITKQNYSSINNQFRSIFFLNESKTKLLRIATSWYKKEVKAMVTNRCLWSIDDHLNEYRGYRIGIINISDLKFNPRVIED